MLRAFILKTNVFFVQTTRKVVFEHVQVNRVFFSLDAAICNTLNISSTAPPSA
jgi:hypothetical protein